ncbi:MAG: HAMP domain-containing protein [Geminicoccaceae bacterium]
MDYLAGGLQGSMLRAGLLMSGLGLVAAGLAVVRVWLALEAWVLRPLGRLGSVGARLGAGELSARVGSTGRDEIAVLGRRFDAMAGDIERYMEVLASRERFLQALLDAIPDGIRVIGPDFGVEWSTVPSWSCTDRATCKWSGRRATGPAMVATARA